MAPKRSAAPPPPPPQVSSSAETATGSGSEEEEEEEEIAQSTPPPAPKSIAPPPQKEQESDASDEDEDGEEEEEEDEGEEEEGDDEDEKANHVIPSSATKNPPPPPPPASREESSSSDEEEEEEAAADEEMPQAKPAPNQEMEAKGAKRPSALFQRTWSTEDEFRILEVLAAHRLEHGTLPKPDVLANALDGKLDNRGCSDSDLQRKVKSLQTMHTKAAKKGAPPSKDHARRLFDLCKNVWPNVVTKVSTKAAAANREPDEMCKLYPYLGEEVKALQKTHPGLFKREFAMIDDSKALALNEKIKKLRHTQMNLYLRRHGLIRDVTKTLMDMTE